MSDVIKVYHGTDMQSAKEICKRIDLSKSSLHTDFGQGFYTNEDDKDAVRWAYRKAKSRNRAPALVTVYFDIQSAAPLITFFEDDLRWGRFVINNRNGKDYIKSIPYKENNLDAKYPITFGRIADVDVLEVAEQLRENRQMLMSLDKILNLKYKHQYAFHTETALKHIVRTTYKEVRE